ncbi:MAG: CDP-archaeol synthase [Patescibacteria group bacterium]|nr:CDP-archaeol synthase [Patescibacteria group bacterium]MDD4303898.1 CDP-archaeol synthase [Patescibacteria group bacterium]MDD4695115.1 CDP-archaeol synthase [Patescibacteria group bacterium]
MIILKLIWLFLPASIANITASIFRSVNFLNYPIDFGFKFREKPLLGKNKTFRGFLFGVLIAIFCVFLQKFFYASTISISMIDYSNINIVLLGFLLGFGALFGDSFKSFFKRQKNIDSGKSWIPFDQIDWIVGAVIFVSFYVNLSFKDCAIAIIFFGAIHPIFNLIGYVLGFQKNKF